jgi:hypothetical protein
VVASKIYCQNGDEDQIGHRALSALERDNLEEVMHQINTQVL